jgi:cytochrome c-type biogenesis protein CcmF
MLLANNVLLSVAMAAVMLGTLYPLFLDALNLGKISVGPPYFDTVFFPLMAPAIFLMAVGPVASWKRAMLPSLWTRLRWAMAVAVVAAIAIPFMLGRFSIMVALGLWLALWVIAAGVVQLRERLATAPQPSFAAKLRAQPLSWYGMTVAHIGIAVFIIGVTLVKGYEREQDLRMAPGEKVAIGGYEFTFKGTREVPGPNYAALQGSFEVRREGSPEVLRTMLPEKRVYQAAGQTMTEAAIDTGFTRDLYVSLGEPVSDSGAWGVRIYYKPFVDWIWGGAFIMAIGGFLALADRRYRLGRRAAAAARAGALAAAD